MALSSAKRKKACGKSLDIALAVVVFLLAVSGAWGYLTVSGLTPGQEHGDSVFMMMSAARWASGYGFYETVPFPVTLLYHPALIEYCVSRMDFFMGRSDVLLPEQVPHRLLFPFEGDTKFIYDRIYLLYAIGWLWRITGISWSSLNVLTSLCAGAAAALSYAIFRLGMGRVLAFLGTLAFVSSPLFLSELPALRDLAKAPFILGAILVVGYLLSHTPRKRALLTIAALTGVFLGIGMGFRQDIIIAPPPILVALLLAPAVVSYSLKFRLILAAVFLACFLVPAYPVVRAARQTGGNNAFYLAQGCTRDMLEDADTTRAAYGPLYHSDDFIMHATIATYGAETRKEHLANLRNAKLILSVSALAALPVDRITSGLFAALAASCRTDLDIWSAESEQVARSLVRDLGTAFPADVITRWYGAALRGVRGLQGKNFYYDASNPIIRNSAAVHEPFTRHFRKYGLWYAGLVFLALLAKNLRLGLGAACVPLYFCGYTSLEFQVRHAFHLDFISYWIAGFLLSGAFLLLKRQVVRDGGQPRLQWRLPPFGPMRRAAGRILAGVLAMGLFLGAPLYAARVAQHYTTDRLLERYASADLEPVPFVETRKSNGFTRYSPEFLRAFDRSWDSPEILSEYLVLEFETRAQNPAVMIEYISPPLLLDRPGRVPELTGTDICPKWGTEEPVTARYFFPAFSFSKKFQDRVSRGYDLPEFSGISVPGGVTVKGLYRVRNKDRFPILMNVWLPEDRRLFKRYYTLDLRP
jgi:hypothetical protein